MSSKTLDKMQHCVAIAAKVKSHCMMSQSLRVALQCVRQSNVFSHEDHAAGAQSINSVPCSEEDKGMCATLGRDRRMSCCCVDGHGDGHLVCSVGPAGPTRRACAAPRPFFLKLRTKTTGEVETTRSPQTKTPGVGCAPWHARARATENSRDTTSCFLCHRKLP